MYYPKINAFTISLPLSLTLMNIDVGNLFNKFIVQVQILECHRVAFPQIKTSSCPVWMEPVKWPIRDYKSISISAGMCPIKSPKRFPLVDNKLAINYDGTIFNSICLLRINSPRLNPWGPLQSVTPSLRVSLFAKSCFDGSRESVQSTQNNSRRRGWKRQVNCFSLVD